MNIKSSARVIVFKYVNLILWKEKVHFRENWLIFLGFGEKLNYSKDLGKKGKIPPGS